MKTEEGPDCETAIEEAFPPGAIPLLGSTVFLMPHGKGKDAKVKVVMRLPSNERLTEFMKSMPEGYPLRGLLHKDIPLELWKEALAKMEKQA